MLLAASDYVPLVSPLPVWDWWYLLLVPLCAAVAIVWKSIKCKSMSSVPREAAVILFWIIAAMVLAGAALAGVVQIAQHR